MIECDNLHMAERSIQMIAPDFRLDHELIINLQGIIYGVRVIDD